MKYETLGAAEVLLYGRTFNDDETIGLSWSASGFCVEFEGTCLSAEWRTVKRPPANGTPYIGIRIDDATEVKRFAVEDTVWKCIVMADHLAFGHHRIRVIKLTESSEYPVYCQKTETDGFFCHPVENFHRKIEFIGDSITCGYGIECPTVDGPFCTAEENVTKAYTMILSEKLRAVPTVIAHSGWAAYKSPYGGSMPECYESVDSVAGRPEPFDFSEEPDLIVINLGTNDSAWVWKDMTERMSAFHTAYADFLRRLRRIYPNAYFVCTIGLMRAATQQEICETVAGLIKDGMKRLCYCPVPEAENYCAGHPCEQAHRDAAQVLFEQISSIKDAFLSDCAKISAESQVL